MIYNNGIQSNLIMMIRIFSNFLSFSSTQYIQGKKNTFVDEMKQNENVCMSEYVYKLT